MQPHSRAVLLLSLVLALCMHACDAVKLKFATQECMEYELHMYTAFYGSYVALPDANNHLAQYMLTITAPSSTKVCRCQGYEVLGLLAASASLTHLQQNSAQRNESLPMTHQQGLWRAWKTAHWYRYSLFCFLSYTRFNTIRWNRQVHTLLTVASRPSSQVFENQYVSEAKFNVVPYETGRYRFCLSINSAQRGLSRYIMQRDVVWDLHIAGADLHHGHAKVSSRLGDESKGTRGASEGFVAVNPAARRGVGPSHCWGGPAPRTCTCQGEQWRGG